MKKIDVKVSFACNNLCKFCVQGDKRKFIKEKSLDQVRNILLHSSKYADSVVFTGGEPTIRKDIVDLVKIASDSQFNSIQIQTNGRLFSYKSLCRNFINAGANEFCLAVHGHSSKIHDFLTSAPGSFRQTVKGIKNLKELGQYVATNTVITTYNYKSLPRIAELLVNLDVNQFQFAFPHILGRAAENKGWIIPKISTVINYVKRGLDIGIKSGKKVMTEAIAYCFMKDYEEFIAEKIIPETKVFDGNLVINNYTRYRRNEGKKRGPNCKKCKYYTVCEGPWREYPEIFGWDEFIPVVNNE